MFQCQGRWKKVAMMFLASVVIFSSTVLSYKMSIHMLYKTSHLQQVHSEWNTRNSFISFTVASVVQSESSIHDSLLNRSSHDVDLKDGHQIYTTDVLKSTYPPTTFSLQTHFPTYIIIGFGKAGTKALYEALKLHPHLSGPFREQRFFSLHYDKGLASYLRSLPAPPHSGFTIEKSPDYITHPLAASRIATSAAQLGIDQKKLKFIVVLRNPADRAMSEYIEWNLQKMHSGASQLGHFDKIVLGSDGRVQSSLPFLNTSCYAYHIKKWFQFFSQEQMCYVDGDMFISNPYKEVHQLEKCMNITPFFTEQNFVYDNHKGFFCFKVGTKLCMGPSKGRKHPEISTYVLDRLNKFFQPWNEQLPKLVGRDFKFLDVLAKNENGFS